MSTNFSRGQRGHPVAFAVSTGKWDQVFTLGVKNKDGDEIEITPEVLSIMMDNFGNRKNKMGMDYEHATATAAVTGAPAPQLAYYNALAMIVDGKVARLVSRDPGVAAPSPEGRSDGLFAHRFEVTPLGESLLPNYAQISPWFAMEDYDEAGNPIGPNLLNISAVSVPFQDGCSIEFSKNGPHDESPKDERFSRMDGELLKKLGLGEGASGDEIKGAMARYMADAEEKLAKYAAAEEEAKKMADEEKKEDDKEKLADDPKDAEKMADDAKDAEKMADDAKDAEKMADDEDEDDKKAMAKALGLGDTVSLRALRYAMDAKLDHLAKLEAMRADLEKLRADQVKAETETFVSQAISDGQWPEDKKDNLASIYRKDPTEAKAVLFKKGMFTLVSKTYRKDLPERAADSADVRAKKGPVSMGADFSAKAQAYAKDNKVSLRDAQNAVAKAHPELYQAYKRGE